MWPYVITVCNITLYYRR